MNIRKEFRNIFLPLLKASPLLIALVALTIYVANKGIDYLPHEYQSMGAIKINNLNYSQSGFDIYQTKNSNTPMQNETFLTEVEIFKSKDLIRKTIQQLDWELTIHRIGDVRITELKEDRPFGVKYAVQKESAYDKDFHLKYIDKQTFHYLINPKKDSSFVAIKVGEWIELEGLKFQLNLEESFLLTHPGALQTNATFVFKVNSVDALVGSISDKNLFVRPVEKDISIIKIYYNHELPTKAKHFVDMLMLTYMEECRSYKEKMSDETLVYLDKQLESVASKLRKAESEMAYFRTKNHLVNTMQETDATLKEITQLDMQDIDFKMQKAALEKLYEHLTSGNSLNDYSPNFKALADPIFQQSYLKVQSLELERKDLLQKYVPHSTEIAHIDSKIKDLRVFINESVRSTLDRLGTRQQEVKKSIQSAQNKIKEYPEKERKLVILEREVSLNENTYNYLMQKRTELAISRSSNLYPHKIIEAANLPKQLIAPNRSLILGLCAFLMLSLGIVSAFIFDYFTAKIRSKEDIEEAIQAPLLGTVWNNKKQRFESAEVVSNLVANLTKIPVSETAGQGKMFLITSMNSGEGKSYISTHLAKTLAASGLKVLLVDMDIRRPSLHQSWNIQNENGVSAILEKRVPALETIYRTGEENLHLLPAGRLLTGNKALFFSNRATGFLADMRWHYDVVIVDSAPIGIVPDAIPLMQESSANLFVVRSGYTHRRLANELEAAFEEWQIPNLYLVLNSYSPSKKYLQYYYS